MDCNGLIKNTYPLSNPKDYKKELSEVAKCSRDTENHCK